MKKNVGTSYFKDLSRKDYVVQASRIIKKEGVEAISIRRIAAELGCSSASMYRYFQNLDELLFYAQLDALNEFRFINLESEMDVLADMLKSDGLTAEPDAPAVAKEEPQEDDPFASLFAKGEKK